MSEMTLNRPKLENLISQLDETNFRTWIGLYFAYHTGDLPEDPMTSKQYEKFISVPYFDEIVEIRERIFPEEFRK